MRRANWALLKKKLRQGDYLWGAKQASRYPAVKLGRWLGRPLAGPLVVHLIVTYRCNARCLQCDLPERAEQNLHQGREEPPREAMLELIDEIAATGASAVAFTGGEPFLCDHLADLVARAKKNDLLTMVSTNGSLLTEDSMGRLVAAGLDGINLSLDSTRADTYDALRGREGSFQSALAAAGIIRNLREKHRFSLTFNIATVISRSNLAELGDLVDFTERLGADRVVFLPFHPDGLLQRREERIDRLGVTDPAEAKKAINTLIAMKRSERPIDNSPRYLSMISDYLKGETRTLPCYAGYVTLAVDCYGDIFPCWTWAMRGRTVGSTERHSLPAFWRSGEYNEIRRTALEECRDCLFNCQAEWDLLFSPFRRR